MEDGRNIRERKDCLTQSGRLDSPVYLSERHIGVLVALFFLAGCSYPDIR